MQVQLNTDKHIKGTQNLERYIDQKLNDSLKHLADKVTRVEVHLSDENADKGGADDILCKLEARVAGKNPILVKSKSDTKEKALEASIDKLKASLGSIIGKMQNH